AVTVAKWRTPKGRDINKSGIVPDVVVNLTSSQQQAMIQNRSFGTIADPQYSKAVEQLTQLIQKSTPITFQKLEAFLKAGKWKDADLETWKLMKKLTKREEEGWLRVEDAKNFPRQELRKMDQLWVKYSNGKFGFSVQKQIWLELGGKLDGEPDWNTFTKLGDRAGWIKNGEWLSYDSYTFSTNALSGHLPGLGSLVGLWVEGGTVLFSLL
ncbi:MAG: GUN4 domain-containing protein, partial [Cuspidothrix sp.]